MMVPVGGAQQGIDPTRWQVIPRTLCFITHGSDVLLMQRGLHKKAFPGAYNGIGGHIERDEDPRSGVIREIYEETGLTVQALRLRGITHIDAGEGVGIMLFVYTAESATRTVIANDEGALAWVPRDQVAAYPLVDDVAELLTRLFDQPTLEPFSAQVSYDEQGRRLTRYA